MKADHMKMENSTEIQEGYIPVTGGKIWYKMIGRGMEGIPVLVVHGGPGVSHDYLEPLEALAGERPVIFYDQLGCGNSDNPDDKSLWTVERFVEELHQIRKALGLRKVHIIGQSWGTALAVEYILSRQPEGVVSLVLSGPLLSASRWIEDQKAYISKLPKNLQKSIQQGEDSGDFTSHQYQEAMMEYYKIHVCRLARWPDCLKRSFEKINFPLYEYLWGPSEFTVTGVLKNYERIDRLKEIKVPVLFTCGSYDEATPETTKYYQSHLHGSQIFVFDDASHEHHLEKPQEYLKIVRDFFDNAEKIENE